jgi:hypothetical protein
LAGAPLVATLAIDSLPDMLPPPGPRRSTKTSRCPFKSPATRFDASESNATSRTSRLSWLKVVWSLPPLDHAAGRFSTSGSAAGGLSSAQSP